MKKELDIPESLRTARYIISKTRPYFVSLLWSLQFVGKTSEHGLTTMAVDKFGRLYYNPDEVAKWTPTKCVLGVLHELNHVLRHHLDRLREHDGKFIIIDGQPCSLANVAQDLEIHGGEMFKSDLSSFSQPLPVGWLSPTMFGFPDGKLSEEYAEMLLKNAKVTKVGMPGSGSPGQAGQGTCGSCAGGHGPPNRWEDGPPSGDSPGMSEAEMGITLRQTAESIREHEAKGRGKVPADLVRWADEQLAPPKVPWQRELASLVRRSKAFVAGKTDFTMQRLSRRQFPDIRLPRLVAPVLELAVQLDTSGSMGSGKDSVLAAGFAEVVGVIKTVAGKSVHFLSVDSAAHTQKVTSRKDIKLVGGGGTDMMVGIKAAVKLKPRPDAVIVITDGLTPWSDTPPPVPVIVCLVGGHREGPPWGRTIVVDDL